MCCVLWFECCVTSLLSPYSEPSLQKSFPCDATRHSSESRKLYTDSPRARGDRPPHILILPDRDPTARHDPRLPPVQHARRTICTPVANRSASFSSATFYTFQFVHNCAVEIHVPSITCDTHGNSLRTHVILQGDRLKAPPAPLLTWRAADSRMPMKGFRPRGRSCPLADVALSRDVHHSRGSNVYVSSKTTVLWSTSFVSCSSRL